MAQKGTYIYEWPRPMVTVDAVVLTCGPRPKVLLIRRGSEPFMGQWAVPGGFVDMDEELEDAVARELYEETGVSGVPLRQMHTFGTVGRDPRGRQITIVYIGMIPREITPRGGDDAAEAAWFPMDKLPDNLAFDHDRVLAMAARAARQNAFGFDLQPEAE